MIEQLINEIVIAEQKAVEIKEEGEIKAKQITMQAESSCSKAKSDAVIQAKNLRNEILKNAEKIANENYNKITDESLKKANDYAQSKKQDAQKISDEVFRGIVNGSC